MRASGLTRIGKRMRRRWRFRRRDSSAAVSTSRSINAIDQRLVALYTDNDRSASLLERFATLAMRSVPTSDVWAKCEGDLRAHAKAAWRCACRQ